MKFNRFTTLGEIIVLITIFLSATHGLAESTMNLVAHYVEVTPNGDGISYNVNIYLSVLDGTDTPNPNLEQKDFAIQEAGSGVDIQSLHTIKDEPLNIVLVMDTSKSMSESDINDAKDAANSFVTQLQPNDQVALIAFDDSPRNQGDGKFSVNRKEISANISELSRNPKAGACIYDAVFSAIKLFPAQTTGSRAVILLTKNSKNNPSTDKSCAHKSDDVINMASNSLYAPIYVYTLGLKLDTTDENEKKNLQALEDLATKTGGLFKHLPTSDKLINTFISKDNSLVKQLQSQYILTYKSISAAGDRSLTISVNKPGQATPLDVDTRNFSLPLLSPLITFTSPLNNDKVGDSLKIAITLTKQDEVVIDRVVFTINNNGIGEDTTKPYELDELDAKQYPIGYMLVSAVAYGPDDKSLAESSVSLNHVESVQAPTLIPTDANIQGTTEAPGSAPTTTTNNNSVVFMAIALSALSIVAIGALIFYLLRQQKQISVLDVDNFPDEDITMPATRSIPASRMVEDNRKPGSFELESDVLGALTIEASDDSSLIGYRFEIMTPLVSLGRSADNDLNFPSDKPVSRHHAEIYQISGKLYLREVAMADSSGTAQPPKYGTFLNHEPLGEDPALLKTGDEIQLGKRVRLKFESFSHALDVDSLTYDEDDDSTFADDADKTSVQD